MYEINETVHTKLLNSDNLTFINAEYPKGNFLVGLTEKITRSPRIGFQICCAKHKESATNAFRFPIQQQSVTIAFRFPVQQRSSRV